MEQSVTAANAKVGAYKTRVEGLENDIYGIRVARAEVDTAAENVRCYLWGSSNNSTFACRRGKSRRTKGRIFLISCQSSGKRKRHSR